MGRRPHHQDGREVQGDRSVRLRCGADQPDLHLQPGRSGLPGFHSVQGAVRQAGDRRVGRVRRSAFEVQAVRRVHPGRLAGQRPSAAEHRPALGLRKDSVLPGFRDPAAGGRRDLLAGSARPRWPDLRRFAGAGRPGHQRLHQQRPQPQGVQGCLAAAPGLLV
ncbi:hypothetical protein D3C73_794620 [compost metagenome]